MENLRKTVLFPCGYPHYLGRWRGGVNNCRVIHGVIQRLSTGSLSYFGITLMMGIIQKKPLGLCILKIRCSYI